MEKPKKPREYWDLLKELDRRLATSSAEEAEALFRGELFQRLDALSREYADATTRYRAFQRKSKPRITPTAMGVLEGLGC